MKERFAPPSLLLPVGPTGSTIRLTLPVVAPPLPDIDVGFKVAGQVVVRPLAHNREVCRAVERDEGELRQVDRMDLTEDLLPRARIRCREFLCVEGIQGRVAVEGKVLSIGRDLVAREQDRIVGVIAKAPRPLGDVVPARYRSRGW